MIETEPLDFAKVESVCWRALCQHQVSERELVLAATVIRLSFVIGRPFVELAAQIELARITGLSKGNVGDMVTRLVSGGALAVSADRRIYTFLPPSRSWPWAFRRRIDDEEQRKASERLETAIVHANMAWPEQPEFFPPEPEREFAEALAIERMRESLLEWHSRATGRNHFPVMDRLPKPAPAAEPDRGEGQSRPLGTGVFDPGGSAPVILQTCSQKGSENAAQSGVLGSRFGYREVPESGTAQLNAFINASQREAPIDAISGEVPDSGTEKKVFIPDDLGMGLERVSEDERTVMEQLVAAMGPGGHKPGCRCGQGMCKYGGWWRIMVRGEVDSAGVRGDLVAVQGALRSLQLRLHDRQLKPVRNCGAWLRDEYHRIRKVREVNARAKAEFDRRKGEQQPN